jgi:6-phosphogluconolactonase
MKITRTLAATCGVAVLGIAGPALSAANATAASSKIVGHVYVNDNTAGTNTIGAFNRHADGSLTPEAGSPFAIGGAGSGAGTGSQGALQTSPDGKYLLAVDAGSNQISVARINADGSVTAVGTPISSGGIKPVSIGVTARAKRRDLVYVANAGVGGSNYTGFTIGGAGGLRPLTDSTIALPDAALPGDILFNGDGTRAAGTLVGSGLIDSYVVSDDGRLLASPGSPYPSQGPGPIGAEFSPTNPSQLFVSNAHGGANNGTVSTFNDSRDGALSSVANGPFADEQTAPCWVEVTHDGRFLFTSNTAVPSISRYSIAKDGTLTLLGSTPLNATTEKGPVDLRLSPNGQNLYVVDGGGVAVSSFAVRGGALTPLTSSPTALPVGSAPVGIVVD